MNAYLFYDPRARPLSISGAILPNAKLKFFVTLTTTPTAVYADAALTTPLGTEVTADSNGQFVPIYMSPLVTYRVQIYDQFGVLQPYGDIDPLCPKPDYPTGTVMWFHGTAGARDVAYPPAQWQILNGTNGTPDGRDRMPVIAGGAFASGDLGGALLSTTDLGGGGGAGVSGSTILDATNMPVHNHRLYVRTSATLRGNTKGFGAAATAGVEGQDIADAPYGYLDVAPSSGGNKLIEATGTVTPVGHTHTVPGIATHLHTIPGGGRPPFVALWALMRRA
jgi:hypothetical protein